MIDGYMSIKEASEIWNVSARRIQIYCTEGRIAGAAKLDREWAIPSASRKPIDKRVTTGAYRNWRNTTASDNKMNEEKNL